MVWATTVEHFRIGCSTSNSVERPPAVAGYFRALFFLRTPKNCCSLSSSTLIKRICQRTGHHGCRPRSTEKLEEMSKASRTVSQKRGRQTRRRRLPVERLCYVQTSRTKKTCVSRSRPHTALFEKSSSISAHTLLPPLYSHLCMFQRCLAPSWVMLG